jgi:Fe-S cluster assembly ATP-binding protein
MTESNILEVRNLHAKIGDKEILKGVEFTITNNSVYALFGPNGSGKTTLMHSLMGLPGYDITGNIIFNGEDIIEKSIDQRSNLGLNISFQNPPIIRGVTLKDMINICLKRKPNEELTQNDLDIVERFKLTDFLDRDINFGFSGGEKKRADILQLLLLKPKLLLLDEPDSGVDIESIKLITREISQYIRENSASAFIITHQGQMMEYITTREACVLLDGKIHCFLEPQKILNDIKEKGYAGCLNCPNR